METISSFAEVAILCAIVSLCFTVKNGFNEVITGLQSVYDRLDRLPRS